MKTKIEIKSKSTDCTLCNLLMPHGAAKLFLLGALFDCLTFEIKRKGSEVEPNEQQSTKR
jgi:hypothetical protein